MSERVTWEPCPNCGRLAAVGWLDGSPVRSDCPNGCVLTPARVASAFLSWPETAFRQQPLRSDVLDGSGSDALATRSGLPDA